MQKIITSIQQLGLPIKDPVFDGIFHHYGERKKVWFVGITHKLNNKSYFKASFGDVRNSSSYTEEDWSSEPTPDEIVEMARILKEIEDEKQKEREAKWDEMAAFASYTFEQCPRDFKPTAYSLRKGIQRGYGARNLSDGGIGSTIIAVPLRNIDGEIRNIQRILPQKDGDGNDKSLLEGAEIGGLFSISNSHECDLKEASALVLSEGWATAASVSAILQVAKQERVLSISCANAGNLVKVAESIRSRFPNLHFTVAADNDYQKTNAGVEAAVKLAKSFGAKIVVPPAEDGITDWNDYYLKYGLEQATVMFYAPQSELLDISVPSTNKDKKKKLNDHQVASIVIQSFGDTIIRETSDDYFKWDETHWIHQDPKIFPLHVQQKLNQYTGSGKASDMKAAWAQFHVQCPVNAKGLFDVVQWKANFLNGTLEVNPETKKVFFYPHRKESFMTTTIPFSLPVEYGEVTEELCREIFEKYPKNSLFLQYIEHAFGESKLADILQVYGAAIIPGFSRIFMAIGNPGSGKSTMAKILIAFLNEKNISCVQPCNFRDFHLHPMVGKIVNIVPELDLKAPIVDHVVKALIDQEPVSVNRKGIDLISARLSPLQVWCGNDLPKSLDGASGAYQRRMTIVRTREAVKNLPQDDQFVIRLIRECAPQILMGSLSEFFTLLKQGGFKQSEASLELVKELEKGSDTIGQFMGALSEGEFNSASNEFRATQGSGFIPATTLYAVFTEWLKANGKYHVSNYEFGRQMERQGFKKIRKRATGSGRQENAVWVYNIAVNQSPESVI